MLSLNAQLKTLLTRSSSIHVQLGVHAAVFQALHRAHQTNKQTHLKKEKGLMASELHAACMLSEPYCVVYVEPQAQCDIQSQQGSPLQMPQSSLLG